MKLFKAAFALAALCVAFVALPAAAQTQTVSVPGGTNNNNQGIMFDITAANAVTITGFTLRQVNTGGTFRVYGRTGTHVGSENTNAGWTLLATGSMAAGADVAFPSPVSFFIPAGQTGALYIASDFPSSMGYRNGTGVGNAVIADANITLREGAGKGSPDFGIGFSSPRAFVGAITYSLGAPAAVPTMTEWAMILFGLILAGGAAAIIQRRRMLA